MPEHTGTSPKGTFTVKTPLATLGIRGTLFDVYVEESSGQTDIIHFSGLLRVCTLTNYCRLVRRSCDIVRVRSSRSVIFRNYLRSGNKARENTDYNLVDNQNRFQEGWRAPTGACDLRAARDYNENSKDGDNSFTPPDTPENDDKDDDKGRGDGGEDDVSPNDGFG